MNKQIALAYAIAGVAVAIALVVTVGSAESPTLTAPPELAPAQEADTPPEPRLRSLEGAKPGTAVVPEESATPDAQSAEAPIEYVYVDQPAKERRAGHRDDDDDDDEHGEGDEREHEEHERREHRVRAEHGERDRD